MQRLWCCACCFVSDRGAFFCVFVYLIGSHTHTYATTTCNSDQMHVCVCACLYKSLTVTSSSSYLYLCLYTYNFQCTSSAFRAIPEAKWQRHYQQQQQQPSNNNFNTTKNRFFFSFMQRLDAHSMMSRALVHQQRLATKESWLIAKSRRLDISFETLFYSSFHIYLVKRWTIIQIFIRVPLKVDATRQKGENLCFFSSFFFYSIRLLLQWLSACKLLQFRRKMGLPRKEHKIIFSFLLLAALIIAFGDFICMKY